MNPKAGAAAFQAKPSTMDTIRFSSLLAWVGWTFDIIWHKVLWWFSIMSPRLQAPSCKLLSALIIWCMDTPKCCLRGAHTCMYFSRWLKNDSIVQGLSPRTQDAQFFSTLESCADSFQPRMVLSHLLIVLITTTTGNNWCSCTWPLRYLLLLLHLQVKLQPAFRNIQSSFGR